MKTGFKNSEGIDLGELFALLPSGHAKVAATGFCIADGSDFADHFAPRTSSHHLIQTGFRIADGRDLGEIFEPLNPSH